MTTRAPTTEEGNGEVDLLAKWGEAIYGLPRTRADGVTEWIAETLAEPGWAEGQPKVGQIAVAILALLDWIAEETSLAANRDRILNAADQRESQWQARKHLRCTSHQTTSLGDGRQLLVSVVVEVMPLATCGPLANCGPQSGGVR